MKVTQLDYHRNGMSGLGFHVGIVEDENREMLAVRFSKEAEEEVGAVLCAAFDLAQLDKREIRFFHNSWRGECYADVMDEAIDARLKAQDLYFQMEQAYHDLQSA